MGADERKNRRIVGVVEYECCCGRKFGVYFWFWLKGLEEEQTVNQTAEADVFLNL